MDGKQLDSLTRLFSRTAQRRGIWRGLGVLGAGLITGGISGQPADAAKCRKPGATCSKKQKCCEGKCKGGACVCAGNKKVCNHKCIGKNLCCKSSDCPAGSVCQANGHCACGVGSSVCGPGCVTTGACCAATDCPAGGKCENDQCVVSLTTANHPDWAYYDDTNDLPATLVIDEGPGTPPIGPGSARITTPTDQDGYLVYGTVFNGTKLSDLSAFSYATYVPATSDGIDATFQIGVDYDPSDNNNNWQGRMVFVPTADHGHATFDTWQTWDLMGNKKVWFLTKEPDPANKKCTQASPCTYDDVLAAYPNIAIHPTALDGNNHPLGFIGAKCGRDYANQVSNVTAFTIQKSSDKYPTVYTFEP